uniref:Uncharacterized protein n=1 Tax=viral metagenome TaxID=1070528 RepID=A0A6M3KLE0_9ZZZZ
MINQEHHADTILLHTPTYSEHPDADRFRNQFADLLKLPVTIQADGRNIWQLMDNEHCLPSERIPFCSRILKTEQAIKFYKTMTEDFIVYFGYDGKEWRRAQRSMARLAHIGVKTAFPLLKTGWEDKLIKEFIRDTLKVCLPEAYLYLNHNNCLPCFKGGKQHFYQIWKHYSEYYEKAEKAEYNIGHTVFKDKSLEQLRHEWESQIPMFKDEDDLRPCMCAL